MGKKSAGILAYRLHQQQVQVLLVHPGGPFFVKKDAGAWSIPKGEFQDDEDDLTAARREFTEELGITLQGPFTALTPVRQKGGKLVYVWTTAEPVDVTNFKCNTFNIEWPPRSGRYADFPEIDKAEWFTIQEAKDKINPAQVAILDELLTLL